MAGKVVSGMYIFMPLSKEHHINERSAVKNSTLASHLRVYSVLHFSLHRPVVLSILFFCCSYLMVIVTVVFCPIEIGCCIRCSHAVMESSMRVIVLSCIELRAGLIGLYISQAHTWYKQINLHLKGDGYQKAMWLVTG